MRCSWSGSRPARITPAPCRRNSRLGAFLTDVREEGDPEGRYGPCTRSRDEAPGRVRRFWLGPGLPASHVGYRLRLLPSGPDLVRRPTLRRTWPSSPPAAALAPRAGPSSGNSAPLERVADYRAPLIPRLARSAGQSSPQRSAGSAGSAGSRAVATGGSSGAALSQFEATT